MLDAYEGDSFWITYGDPATPKVVVIDAGRKRTYRALMERIEAYGRPIELFVMTHVDDDHIFGAIPLFGDTRVTSETFGDVWYNCFTHMDPAVAKHPEYDILGPKNGEIFAGLLLQSGQPWNKVVDGATIVVPDDGDLPTFDVGGMSLTLLSPSWPALKKMKTYWERELEEVGMEPNSPEEALEIFAERRDLQPDVLGDGDLDDIDVDFLVEAEEHSDDKEANGSSIAFLAEFEGKAALFTGDAHPPILEASLHRLLEARGEDRLRLDAFKIPHHGSKKNMSTAILDLIDCRKYLISTSGAKHGHPDAECIARIVHANVAESQPTQLYFSHESGSTEVWSDVDLMADWNYEVHYPLGGRDIDLI